MKSQGPGQTVKATEFAAEIVEAKGEWVETQVFPDSTHNQYVNVRIGKLVAELTFRRGTMYGRMKDKK